MNLQHYFLNLKFHYNLKEMCMQLQLHVYAVTLQLELARHVLPYFTKSEIFGLSNICTLLIAYFPNV